MGMIPKARVFISCGQQKGTTEVKIAHRIADELGKMGFEPYIAVAEQTLKGVKENIFRRLSESEYFIFVDFRRERLFKPTSGGFTDTYKHRGSLFSHQELAIATFLDIEALAFREKDVKEEDGILKFIQANCAEFTDRRRLPDFVAKVVDEKITKGEWDQNWRNELLLERGDKDFQDVGFVGGKYRPARYYHIKVKNQHWRKMARDCVAYLERVKDLSTGDDKSIEELVEFKWKGMTTPRIAIPPTKHRYLDAFHIFYDSQNIVELGINPFVVDFSGYYELYTLKGPGTFELTYVVFSENFSPRRATFRLHIGNQLEDTQFYKEEQCSNAT